MRYNVPKENDEQQAVFQWAAYAAGAWPELKLLHAIPNGATTGARQGACLVAEGVKKGVPDMMLPVARGKYHGLYIELKRTKGGKLEPEQRRWLAELNAQEYLAVRCNGWVAAANIIERYIRLAVGEGIEG